MNTRPKNALGLRRSQSGRYSHQRAGLSLLEFIGCFMALVGGVWLGAIYLGIDVRHLAYVALSESTLLEKVPEQWRPADPQSADAPSPAELARSVKEELAALRHEINALRSTHNQSARATTERSAAEDSPSAASAPSPQTKAASLAFWNRVQDVVNGQTALQMDAESAATNANATKVAALKGRISRFAASAIRSVPSDGVDRSAVELGHELAIWYERGGALYDGAVRIWESPARSRNNPAITQDWEHARSQHNNEGKLLNEKIAAVRASLARRFGEGFAEFIAL